MSPSTTSKVISVAESSPVVKVIMDSEKFIKRLMAICYNRDVDPDSMGHLLNYAAAAVNLDPEQVAAWITEEVQRINEEALDEEKSPEPTDEAPEEPGDSEA